MWLSQHWTRFAPSAILHVTLALQSCRLSPSLRSNSWATNTQSTNDFLQTQRETAYIVYHIYHIYAYIQYIHADNYTLNHSRVGKTHFGFTCRTRNNLMNAAAPTTLVGALSVLQLPPYTHRASFSVGGCHWAYT